MESDSQVDLQAEHLERAAMVLKTVAHPMRLRVIDVLEKGEKTVTELCQILGMQQPSMSQQLNLMKAKGVLASRRNGNLVYYSISEPSVVKVIQCVRQQSAAWDALSGICLKPSDGSSDNNLTNKKE